MDENMALDNNNDLSQNQNKEDGAEKVKSPVSTPIDPEPQQQQDDKNLSNIHQGENINIDKSQHDTVDHIAANLEEKNEEKALETKNNEETDIEQKTIQLETNSKFSNEELSLTTNSINTSLLTDNQEINFNSKTPSAKEQQVIAKQDLSTESNLTINSDPIVNIQTTNIEAGSNTPQSLEEPVTTETQPAISNNEISHTSTATSSAAVKSEKLNNNIEAIIANNQKVLLSTPELSTNNTLQGIEDQTIDLNLSASIGNAKSSFVVIKDIPNDAYLSAGTKQPDGSWLVKTNELNNLKLTSSTNFSGEMLLKIELTTQYDNQTATISKNVSISVGGEADTPTVKITDVSGTEDSVISLNIEAALADTSGENLAIIISNLPTNASLSAGTLLADGSWQLSTHELKGLTLTPPPDFSGNLELEVKAIASENDTEATTVKTLEVSVSGTADKPVVTIENVSGTEDSAVSLNIKAAISDMDGSESLTSITISGLPEEAFLSAGHNNGNDSWTLSPEQLNNLKLTPPNNYSGNFDLTVTAVATENDTQTSITNIFSITINAIADSPSLMVANASGFDNTPISLSIDASLTDNSESLNVLISGIPQGITLSGGENLADGSWILTSDQLNNLTLIPDSGAKSFDLTVTAIATENSNQDTASTSKVIHVEVQESLNIIKGSKNNDNLTGTNKDDAMYGGEGKDNLQGKEGDDLLYGEAGDDTLKGGAGDDVLYGGSGNDSLKGGAGNDILSGEANNDSLLGESGSDLFIFGKNSGKDTVDGGKGGSWIDTIRLEDVQGPPADNLKNPDNWTLKVSDKSSYSIDHENQILQFKGEGSGTITLADGSELTFNNIEKIEW